MFGVLIDSITVVQPLENVGSIKIGLPLPSPGVDRVRISIRPTGSNEDFRVVGEVPSDASEYVVGNVVLGDEYEYRVETVREGMPETTISSGTGRATGE